MFSINLLWWQLNTKKWYKCWIVLLWCLWISVSLDASQSSLVSSFFTKHDESTNAMLIKVFQRLFTEQDIGHAAQVNWCWKQAIEQSRYKRLFDDKRKLYALILEVTEAEVNEVQRARDRLTLFLEKNSTHLEIDLLNQLSELLQKLWQPEDLIIRFEKYLYNLIAYPSSDHMALAPLRQVITMLDTLTVKYKVLIPILSDVVQHYRSYLNAFDNPAIKIDCHIEPKALLTGEHFLQDSEHHAPLLYRITQDMALRILSMDYHGLPCETNIDGSHLENFIRSKRDDSLGVHFKSSLRTCMNLPVGQESALYWFSKVLFGRGMAPSALVSLNNVTIKSPPEGSQLHADYQRARHLGQTSADFFTKHIGIDTHFTYSDCAHVVQPSYHIEGPSLNECIQQDCQFDSASFSEQILISLLTNPADGKPDNFRVKKDSKGTNHIIGIDNNMALGAPVVQVRKYERAQILPWHMIGVKNFLYCLPEMHKTIDKKVAKKLLSLDVQELIMTWLHLLTLDQQGYECLTRQCYHTQGTYTNMKNQSITVPYLNTKFLDENYLHLPIGLPPTIVEQLTKKLHDLKDALSNNLTLTHQDLFLRIQPLVARFYQAMITRHSDKPLLDCYGYIHGRHCVIYEKFLEEVLENTQEILPCNLTVGAALARITTRPDERSQYITLIDACNQILSRTDVLTSERYFLAAARYLMQYVQRHDIRVCNDNIILHKNWYHRDLLFKALEWRCSSEMFSFLKAMWDSINKEENIRS